MGNRAAVAWDSETSAVGELVAAPVEEGEAETEGVVMAQVRSVEVALAAVVLVVAAPEAEVREAAAKVALMGEVATAGGATKVAVPMEVVATVAVEVVGAARVKAVRVRVVVAMVVVGSADRETAAAVSEAAAKEEAVSEVAVVAVVAPEGEESVVVALEEEAKGMA